MKYGFNSEDDQNMEVLALIAELAYNSILLLDSQGDILWANKGFEELYGYSFKEYIQRDKENQAFIRVLRENDADFFNNNKALTYTRLIFTQNEERKWIQSTLTPIKDKEDKIERFIVIETDITQQKDVEEELIQRQENTQTLSEHIESVKDYIEEQIVELNDQKQAIEEAKDKSEEVLNKVLPYEVAIQLKKKGFAAPRHYKKVTILQLNVRNFIDLANALPIDALVEQLHQLLEKIDGLLEAHFVEKIKTNGGNYLAAGGVPLRNRSNPIDVVLGSLKIKDAVQKYNDNRIKMDLPVFELAFGIHTGQAIAGVVGKTKLSYDIWGEAVNVSAAVEQNSDINKIIVTQNTINEVEKYFEFEPCGAINSKAYNNVELYEVLRIKPEFSNDEKGLIANSNFTHLLSKL